MDDFSKSEKKELRSLSAKAYEIELAQELKKLENSFTAWKNVKINSHELDEKIHEYHSGTRRSLYNMYTQNSNYFQIVARAVAIGIIHPDQMSRNLCDKLEAAISFFRKNLEPVGLASGKAHE